MSITSGKSHPTYLYNLCGHVLSSVQMAKYLGNLGSLLQMSCLGPQYPLEFGNYYPDPDPSHVHSIHSRANSILGFLRRNLQHCPAKLKETAYITLVRSTLEYAASIWDPHLANDCGLLEKLLVFGRYRYRVSGIGRYPRVSVSADTPIILARDTGEQQCVWPSTWPPVLLPSEHDAAYRTCTVMQSVSCYSD